MKKLLLLIIAVASLVNAYQITYGMEAPTPNIKRKSGEQQSLDKKLIDAVKKNDTAKAESLLKQNAYINTEDDQDRTPLHIAVDNDNIEMVTLLLKNKPYILTTNKKGWTPVLTALSDKKDIKIRTLLLHEHLMRSIESGDGLGEMVFYIKEIGKIDAINTKHFDGRTLLNVAVHKGDKKYIKWLLKEGADPNIEGIDPSRPNGITPLDVAKKDEIKIILLAHTSPEEVQHIIPFFMASKKEKEPLALLPNDIRNLLAKNDAVQAVVDEKFKKAKQYLPNYDEKKLRQAIEEGVIQAIKRK